MIVKNFKKKIIKTFPKVVVLILNWNGKDITRNLIESIIKNTEYPKEKLKIVVVDNGSKDGSANYLRKLFGTKIDVLKLDKNYGYSIGINKGLKYSMKKYNPDFFVILNNDMKIVDKKWIKKMLEVFSYNEKILSVGCDLIFPDGKLQYSGVRNFSKIFVPAQISATKYKRNIKRWELVYVGTGAPMMIKKETIEKIGYLDEIFTPSSSEEIDYLIRISESGYLNAYSHETRVIHYMSLTWKRFPNFYRFWLLKRNIFILHLKHFKKFLPIVFFNHLIATLIDKKDDLGPYSLTNLKFRDFTAIHLKYFLYSFLCAVRLYVSKYKEFFINKQIEKIN